MRRNIAVALNRFDAALKAALKWISILLLTGMTIILTLNMIVRFVPFMSMHWFDEILELMFSALIFYGSAAVWVVHGNFSVGDWISRLLPGVRSRLAYRFLVETASLVFVIILFRYSLDLLIKTDEMTTAFAISKKWLYSCMPIAGWIMIIYSIKNMYVEFLKITDPDAAINSDKEDFAL